MYKLGIIIYNKVIIIIVITQKGTENFFQICCTSCITLGIICTCYICRYLIMFFIVSNKICIFSSQPLNAPVYVVLTTRILRWFNAYYVINVLHRHAPCFDLTHHGYFKCMWFSLLLCGTILLWSLILIFANLWIFIPNYKEPQLPKYHEKV